MSKLTNIIPATLPLHIVTKYVGFMTYSVKYKNGVTDLKLTKTDMFLQLIKIVTMSYYFLMNKIFFKDDKDVIENIMKQFQVYSITFITIIQMLSIQIYYKDFFKVFYEINKSDIYLQQLNLMVDYKNVFIFSTSMTGLVISMPFIQFFTNYQLAKFLDVHIMVIYSIATFIMLSSQNMLFSICHDLKNRYVLLNEKLLRCFVEDSFNENLTMDVLGKIVFIHGFLYHVCRKLNRVFNVNLLCSLTWGMCACVIALYYNVVKETKDDESVVYIFWCTMNFVNVLFIVVNTFVVSLEVTIMFYFIY